MGLGPDLQYEVCTPSFLRTNQELVGYSHNGHATIVPMSTSCPADNAAHKLQNWERPLLKFLPQLTMYRLPELRRLVSREEASNSPMD